MDDDAPSFPEDALEDGRLLFSRDCVFTLGVAKINGLPDEGPPEVAFIGRSNVGKSSLINALTGRKALARTSNTPGRTRELNFFLLDQRLYLVDLPGYGYAKAGRNLVNQWTKLAKDYLRGRSTLRRAFVLIDGRHGPKSTDVDMMKLLNESAVSYQAVLTKCDHLKREELVAVRAKTADALRRQPAAHPDILATSSAKGLGLDTLRATIADFTTQ